MENFAKLCMAKKICWLHDWIFLLDDCFLIQVDLKPLVTSLVLWFIHAWSLTIDVMVGYIKIYEKLNEKKENNFTRGTSESEMVFVGCE